MNRAEAFVHHLFACIVSTLMFNAAAVADPPRLRPDRPDAIYRAGETVGFSVSIPDGTAPEDWRYVVRENNVSEVATGLLERVNNRVRIEFKSNRPAFLRVIVEPARNADDKSPRAVAGVAVDPQLLRPVADRPTDFDAFWERQIESMRRLPLNARILHDETIEESIWYQTFRLDHVRNSGVYGQIARPTQGQTFPAMVIFQWASPPYPLQRDWVLAPARKGWLAMNVQPHDVLPTEPQAYYDALPESKKKYERVGIGDLESTFFVEMYLRTVRAIDHLATRDDWDGRTLVVVGTSMGGMQGVVAAALGRRVTHLLVCEPAGCDMLASLHGRQTGYPFLPTDDERVARTLGYLDVIHFASRITVPTLVGVGFIDDATPPTGIWTMFNQLAGPREIAPMPLAAHNNLSTPEQLAPFDRRQAAWLDAIRAGRAIEDERVEFVEPER